MPFQFVKEELFFVEYIKGEEKIKQRICDFDGHEIADHNEIKGTYIIQKGTCKKCGEGDRFWKLSKDEAEDFRKEMESLR